MSERAYVDGVRRLAPSLQLLGYFLGVWRGEDASNPGCFERYWKIVENRGDGV